MTELVNHNISKDAASQSVSKIYILLRDLCRDLFEKSGPKAQSLKGTSFW